MASVKARALRDFYDKRERASRKAGEVFDASPARIRELNACGPEQCGAPLVEEIAPDVPARRAEE